MVVQSMTPPDFVKVLEDYQKAKAELDKLKGDFQIAHDTTERLRANLEPAEKKFELANRAFLAAALSIKPDRLLEKKVEVSAQNQPQGKP